MDENKDLFLDLDDFSALMSPAEMLGLNENVMADMMTCIDWSEGAYQSDIDSWKGYLELDATGTACIRSEHSYSVLADEKSDGMSIHDGDSGGSLSDDGSLPSPGMNNREMNFAELTSSEELTSSGYDSPDIIDIKPRPCDDDDELADLRAASDGQTVPLVVLADQSAVKRHPSLLQAVAASLSSKSLSPATVFKSVQQSQTLSKLTKGTAIFRQVSSLRSAGPGRRSLLTKSLATSGRGELHLTDEERRTFISEGYPIPTRLPLSRAEEQNLKRVRRKIKNKISAQESRRKKRDYVELLEKRSEIYGSENNQLKRKVEQLEAKNRSLLSQLQQFRDIIGRTTRSLQSPAGTAGTCLMVLMVFFALCMGVWTPVGHHDNSWPLSSWLQQNRPLVSSLHDPYTTPNVKTRMLQWMPGEDDEDGVPTSTYRDMLSSWVSGLCLPPQHHSHSPQFDSSSPLDDGRELDAASRVSESIYGSTEASENSPAAAVVITERTVVAKSLGSGLVVNCTM